MEKETAMAVYQAIESLVINFAPLNRNRACRMDFRDLSLFFWANEQPQRPLIHAKAFGVTDGEYAQVKYWEIDDA